MNKNPIPHHVAANMGLTGDAPEDVDPAITTVSRDIFARWFVEDRLRKEPAPASMVYQMAMDSWAAATMFCDAKDKGVMIGQKLVKENTSRG